MEDPVLLEVLMALDLPKQGLLRWLDHLERFYRKHSGTIHYAECLRLVEECRAAVTELERTRAL